MVATSENNTMIGNTKAKDIKQLRDREYSRQSNFRTLWQSTADLIFPQTYEITGNITPGTELMSGLFDTTAVEEAENTSSNIVSSLFPPGQQFFVVSPPQYLRDDQQVRQYIPYLVEQTHEQIFNSNFMAQVSNTIHYWFVFGTAALYCDWSVDLGLNYRDYAIGTYQCLENAAGMIDTIILTCPMTARQIVQQFGHGAVAGELEACVGRSVAQAYLKPDARETEFKVIQLVGPRDSYDSDAYLRDARRAPVESCYVQEKDEILLDEGGYDEFPFAVPRYQVIYRETYGRGRGTLMLPKVRQLNRRAKDYDEMSNKWVRPPLEILDTFEGVVDLTPAAQNFVVEKDTVRPINFGASGQFPVTKDILEYYREGVRDGFLRNAFEPITPLKGDRRNTTELIQRISEGLKKQAKPFGRLFSELLSPFVMRTIRLLVRNGVVMQPPDSLRGTPLKIEFVNPLALALRDQQARGGQRWVATLGEAAQIFPETLDNVDYDKWARDLGESFGVKADHIRPLRDVQEIRQQRAIKQQEQEQLALAAAAAEGYQKVTKAPEPGSPLSGQEVSGE